MSFSDTSTNAAEGTAPGIPYRCAADADLTLVEAGPALLDALGWTEEELRGRFGFKLSRLVHPDDLKLAGGELAGRQAFRLATKEGGWRWFANAAVGPVCHADNDTPIYQGILSNIDDFASARGGREKELCQSVGVMSSLGSEFENLFLINPETGGYAHFRADPGGIHRPVLSKTLRYSDYQDGLRTYIDEFVAPEDREYLRRHTTTEAFLAETPDAGVRSLTYRRVHEDQTIFYQLSSAKFTDEDGARYLVLGFRDIDDIVQAEQQRSAELATMHAIIEAAEMGTWRIELVDGKPPRMLADARMLELLGLTRDAAGKTPEQVYDAWFSRIKPEALQSVLDSVERMKAGNRDENTYLWVHPTLGERYVRCGGTAVDIPGGKQLRGYHYDVDDIVREQISQGEQLKEALNAAEHANRAKTTFLNSMSHDIRTPMNAIMGYTALAESHIDNKDQVIDYLEKISVSSSHLLSLINDVLDMSRIESGKVVIKERETSLPDVMRDIRTIMQANVKAKQLTFLVDTLDVVHETAVCDSLRLQQVLLNMLSNAVKFTPTGGTIALRVTELPSGEEGRARYEFSVRDTGIGITKEFQEHIFEPFTREESSTVSGIQGTGLGMAITKNIVDMMGGQISVTSEPGRGSEFVVSLECRCGALPAEPDEIAELRGVRVLVADDDSSTAISVSNMLKSVGMRSDWTLSGKEAVLRARAALTEGDPYGAYIVDWQMPDMNGVEAVRRIRGLLGDSDVPIVISSAYEWADVEEAGRSAGATAFVSKPIFASELHRVLCSGRKREKDADAAGAGAGVEGSASSIAEKIARAAADADIAGARVLLAEDNDMNREIAEAILSQHGIEVASVVDGDEAVEALRGAAPGDYDLVLMDIQMPRMNGYDATRAIRALPNAEVARIPIVATTANAFEEDRALAEEAGMDGYIVKPIDIDKAVKVIHRFVRR